MLIITLAPEGAPGALHHVEREREKGGPAASGKVSHFRKRKEGRIAVKEPSRKGSDWPTQKKGPLLPGGEGVASAPACREKT